MPAAGNMPKLVSDGSRRGNALAGPVGRGRDTRQRGAGSPGNGSRPSAARGEAAGRTVPAGRRAAPGRPLPARHGTGSQVSPLARSGPLAARLSPQRASLHGQALRGLEIPTPIRAATSSVCICQPARDVRQHRRQSDQGEDRAVCRASPVPTKFGNGFSGPSRYVQHAGPAPCPSGTRPTSCWPACWMYTSMRQPAGPRRGRKLADWVKRATDRFDNATSGSVGYRAWRHQRGPGQPLRARTGDEKYLKLSFLASTIRPSSGRR